MKKKTYRQFEPIAVEQQKISQSVYIIVRNKIFKVTQLDLFKKKEINIFLNDAISKMERNFINNSLSNIDNKLNNLLNLFQNK